MTSSRFVCIGLIGLLAAVSCRPPAVKHAAAGAALPAPEAALSQLRQASAARTNLRALGRLTYFGEQGRVRLKAVLVAKRPDRFRFETISPLEQPIDVMTCDGQLLSLLSKERFREGEATPDNIARLLPLPLTPREVVDTLLGGAPSAETVVPKAIAWQDDRWLLTLGMSGGERAELLIDPARLVIERFEVKVGESAEVRLSVTFDDFERLPGDLGEFPRSLRVKSQRPGNKRGEDVSIVFKELEVNVELADSLFRIDPPRGTTPEPLEGFQPSDQPR